MGAGGPLLKPRVRDDDLSEALSALCFVGRERLEGSGGASATVAVRETDGAEELVGDVQGEGEPDVDEGAGFIGRRDVDDDACDETEPGEDVLQDEELVAPCSDWGEGREVHPDEEGVGGETGGDAGFGHEVEVQDAAGGGGGEGAVEEGEVQGCEEEEGARDPAVEDVEALVAGLCEVGYDVVLVDQGD